MRGWLLAMTLLAALPSSAAAQPAPREMSDVWRHVRSGIEVPRSIGDMRMGTQRDLSDDAGLDMIVQFGTDEAPATLYIYRSAYPNAALWFERTRLAMATNVQSTNEQVEPRSFTLGGGGVVNGLREELTLPTNARFRTTAVAIAHHGEWMVKFRITSTDPDLTRLRSRLDAMIAAVRLPASPAIARPLVVPQPCAEGASGSGSPMVAPVAAALRAATVTAGLTFAEARGRTGLANEPASWCRVETDIPAQYVSVFRHRQSGAWVGLMGDSGQAITARTLVGATGAVVLGSSARRTAVAGLYTAIPSPEEALPAALPVAVGRSRGLAEVTEGPSG